MRRTRFGTLLLAVGWACFPLALVFHTLAPAMLGALLLAVVLGARRPTVDLVVERDAPASATVGEPFEVVTRVTDSLGAPLSLEDVLPPGVRVVATEADSRRGAATRRSRVVADSPGALLWTRVAVRYHDPWGIWEADTQMPLPSLTQVRPEPGLVAMGRHLGRSLDARAQVKSRQGFNTAPEIELLREYQPGDRMRDIDWAHSSRLGTLVSRQMQRETARPVVFLLQADRSMRMRRRASKFATSVRAAAALASAVESRGVGVGLVAWSEEGLEAQVRVASGRKALTEAMTRLSALPPPVAVARVPTAMPSETARRVTPRERAFLKAIDGFGGGPGLGATPFETALAALARVASQPSLVIAFLDAEEKPGIVRLVLERLRRRGHRVLVVAPASGAHHYALDDVDEPVVAQLLTWQRNRAEAADTAQRNDCPYVVLQPDVSAQVIREVIRSARS